jgi:hypothetical protein
VSVSQRDAVPGGTGVALDQRLTTSCESHVTLE